MLDLTGGSVPDIVLRSKASGENRIYVEVKDTQPLGYGLEDSQIIRYFLHLISHQYKKLKRSERHRTRSIALRAVAVVQPRGKS